MRSDAPGYVRDVRYTVNLLEADVDVREWARRREGEGWQALSVADHVFTSRRPYPHVWVSAAAMAMSTVDVTISTAFVNNLFRSPVEVAQAALQMQMVADGRFELGLGAGWADDEVTGSGLRYPPPGERAGMYAEAATIVRTLLHERSCSFRGEHYDIEVPAVGPAVEPPPLVGSVGGPRTIREVTPHLDRVEIKAQSAATKHGALDLPTMAAIPDSHLVDMIERVRAVRPDVELSMFTLFSVGDDPVTTSLGDAMREGGGLFRRFFGSPEFVAEGMEWLESLGFSSASLSPMTPQSLEGLAPHVL